MAQASAAQAPAPNKESDTVKCRVKHGRVLVGREVVRGPTGEKIDTTEHYASTGDIIEIPRAEAKRLAERSFEGYPSPDGQPGKLPGTVQDSPIEILG